MKNNVLFDSQNIIEDHLVNEKESFIEKNKKLMLINLLFFYAFLIFCNYIPIYMREQIKDISNLPDGLLVSNIIYYVTKIFFAIIAGYSADYFSPKKTLIFGIILTMAGQIIITSWIFLYDIKNAKFWIFLIGRSIYSVGTEFNEVSYFLIFFHWFFNLEPCTKFSLILCFRSGTFIIIRIISTSHKFLDNNMRGDENKMKRLNLSCQFMKVLLTFCLFFMILVTIISVNLFKKESKLEEIEKESNSDEEAEGNGKISFLNSIKLVWRYRFLAVTITCGFILNAYFVLITNFNNFYNLASVQLYLDPKNFSLICGDFKIQNRIKIDANKFFPNNCIQETFAIASEFLISISGYFYGKYIDKNGRKLNVMMLTSILMGGGYIFFGINLYSYCTNLDIIFLNFIVSILIISIAFSANYVIFYTFPTHFAKKNNRGIFLGVLMFILHLINFSMSHALRIDQANFGSSIYYKLPDYDKYFFIYFTMFIGIIFALISFYFIQIYEYKHSDLSLSLDIISRLKINQIEVPEFDQDHSDASVI